jgi:beta-mannosidase
VRFAAECLAFANPPERAHAGTGIDPKLGVPRDPGATWDFADVRDFYVRSLFGVDPSAARGTDAAYALDLGRAAVAEAMSATLSEWRRPGSHCAGGLVLAWQDLWPGSGWGVLDSSGSPKAPWYALRRALDPVAVLLTDEGLSGLMIHVSNDRDRAFRGELRLAAYSEDGLRVEDAVRAVEVDPHRAITVSASALLDGFRDLTRAYRFGPPAHDVVVATLTGAGGASARDAFYFPMGLARPRVDDIGLRATAARSAGNVWALTITSNRCAQWVAIDVPGFAPGDSWFHLAPGATRTIGLTIGPGPDADRQDPSRTPRGEVRALNSLTPAAIIFD